MNCCSGQRRFYDLKPWGCASWHGIKNADFDYTSSKHPVKRDADGNALRNRCTPPTLNEKRPTDHSFNTRSKWKPA